MAVLASLRSSLSLSSGRQSSCRNPLWLAVLGVIFAASTVRSDEGMYPVSELATLDLPAKGLRLETSDVFNPDGVSLIDGICRVNGCTGSFLSTAGLIITNHHCAYRAIQTASTPERDYLADGFVAKTRADEVPAPGYTVRITQSYLDVSSEVLRVVTSEMPFLERAKAVEKRRKELEQEAEAKHPGLRAEVAEMFTGKTYVLFLYTYLKDVRLVFAPPQTVGNFGGAIDNWEWPRHTGDFSLMRAYTAPDGSSAEYAPENIPYVPKRFLQVAPAGVAENDFVMLLGYPGRTARHKTSHFLIYERDVRLPHLVDLYQWEIGVMEEQGAGDRGVALQHASRIQSLANVEKRSRGQLQGLARAGIIEARQAEEQELRKFIAADPQREARYGRILEDLAAFYQELTTAAPRELEEQTLTSVCRSLALAFTIYDAAHQRQMDDLLREPPYMKRNWDLTVQQLLLNQKDLDQATDRRMFAEVLRRLSPYLDGATGGPRAAAASDDAGPQGIPVERLRAIVDPFFATTRMGDATFVKACLEMTPAELEATGESALKMIAAWYPRLMELREREKERDGRLNQLYGELQTVKSEFLATRFIPDANGTLRLTYGYVRGFSPQDAVVKTPFTTLRGLIEKTTGKDPFVTPQAILDRYAKRDFGTFLHPRLQQVPVAFLYSTDTTGGNSGSPVMNAKGELVGVNFDRTFEATINDFAWNENYSRSIGVDIRYVLWLVGTVFENPKLLDEMGVPRAEGN